MWNIGEQNYRTIFFWRKIKRSSIFQFSAKHSVNFVGRDRFTQKAKHAQTLKTIVVKPKNIAQSAAKTKTDILSNLNPIIDSELDVVKVKSIKDGGVLLKCSDPKEEFKKLVSKENMKENYMMLKLFSHVCVFLVYRETSRKIISRRFWLNRINIFSPLLPTVN
jgi:hypothetical protein